MERPRRAGLHRCRAPGRPRGTASARSADRAPRRADVSTDRASGRGAPRPARALTVPRSARGSARRRAVPPLAHRRPWSRRGALRSSALLQQRPLDEHDPNLADAAGDGELRLQDGRRRHHPGPVARARPVHVGPGRRGRRRRVRGAARSFDRESSTPTIDTTPGRTWDGPWALHTSLAAHGSPVPTSRRSLPPVCGLVWRSVRGCTGRGGRGSPRSFVWSSSTSRSSCACTRSGSPRRTARSAPWSSACGAGSSRVARRAWLRTTLVWHVSD